MSIMNEGVFVRPRWEDKSTDARFAYLMDYAYWTGSEVVNYALEEKMGVNELTEEGAVRSELKNFLDYQNPIFFFHFSHGGTDTLTGQGMTTLICCNDFVEGDNTYAANHNLLSNRVVYTLSCSSANELGPKAVEDGCIAYIGYRDPLWATALKSPETDYALFEVWAGGAKALIDGKTTEEAFYFLKRKYKFWINYWEMIVGTGSEDEWMAAPMLMVLEKNLKGLTLLGNSNAKIRE